MIVGGSDIVMEAPPDAPIGDLILGRMRLLWGDAWFQDADEELCLPIHDPRVYLLGGRSREFFIYRDRAAFDAWERDGATPANLDAMLYFIVGDPPADSDEPRQVTLACGERTDEVETLVEDLESSFRSYLPARPTSARRVA